MYRDNKFSLAIIFFFIVLTLLQQACLGQSSPQDFLKAHNAARSEVGVENIEWDETVTAFAQNYVNSRLGDCNLVHSSNRSYGENLAKGSGDLTGKEAVDLWVSEKQFYNVDSNTCAAGQICGHYAQVVWRDSIRLGCARRRCSDGWWFVSCNYDPPGAYFGEKPFERIPCNGTKCDNASAPEQGHDMPSPPPVETAPSPEHHQTGDEGTPPTQTAPSSNNYQTEHGPNSRTGPTKKVVIVVLLCIGGVIIASITMFCFVKRQHLAKGLINKERNEYVEKFLLQYGSLAPRRYKYSEIKKITKSFGDKLGKGGYGSVYKGTLPDGSLVAVKVLTETDSNGEEFINEVASISRTSHVNIVTLLGFCYEGSKRALVYEFMPNQSLDKFLNNKGDTDSCLNLEKLFEITVGIAKGLEYLHTGCSTRIVHFDIKPQNILLDEDLCPKISDFGLAKLCKKKQSVLSVLGTRGTVGYIAPEVFSRNFGSVSHKSDVYSYGMMVLEMVGAKDVVETPEVAPSSENYFPDKIYEQEILGIANKVDNLMIEGEEETRRKMFLIGFWCIQTIPSDRPSMYKVVEMLEGSLSSIQIPPKPFLFTPNLPNQDFSSTFSAHVETENSAED